MAHLRKRIIDLTSGTPEQDSVLPFNTTGGVAYKTTLRELQRVANGSNGASVSNSQDFVSAPFFAMSAPSVLDTTSYTSIDQWVVDEEYGVYIQQGSGNFAVSFKPTNGGIDSPALSLSGTGLGGTVTVGHTPFFATTTDLLVKRHGVAVEASKKYTCNVRVKSVGTSAIDTFTVQVQEYESDGTLLGTSNVSSALGGSFDWTNLPITFTTSATTAYIAIRLVLGVSGVQEVLVDLDKSSLYRVIEDVTTNSGGKLMPTLKAQTDIRKVSRSADESGAYANTYTAPTAVSEASTNKLTFVARDKYTTTIKLYVVNKGTARGGVLIHDASNNNVVGSTETTNFLSNAQLVANAWNEFRVPGILTPGNTYHIHVLSQNGDMTIKTDTSGDLETASYILHTASKTKGFNVSANGSGLQFTDEDGLLHNSVLNLNSGTYHYHGIFTESGTTFADIPYITDVIEAYGEPNYYNFSWANGLATTGARNGFVIKVNTILPINSMRLLIKATVASGRSFKVQISRDGNGYKDLQTIDNNYTTLVRSIDLPSEYIGLSTFYLRMSGETSSCYTTELAIDAKVSTKGITSGVIKDLDANPVYSHTVSTGFNVDRIYYYKDKFLNEFGQPYPALYATNSTSGIGSVVFLTADNSYTGTPTISVIDDSLFSAGTGSSVADGFVLTDGEYITVTSPSDFFELSYKAGSGDSSFVSLVENVVRASTIKSGLDGALDNNGLIAYFITDPTLANRVEVLEASQDVEQSEIDIKSVKVFGNENADFFYTEQSPLQGYGLRDALTKSEGHLTVLDGEYDMSNTTDYVIVPSDTILGGNKGALLYSDTVADSSVSTPGILRIEPGSENIRVSDLNFRGNFNNQLTGSGAGNAIKVVGTPASYCKDITISNNRSKIFATNYYFICVDTLKVQNCTSINGERGMYIALSKNVSVNGFTARTETLTVDVGSGDPWMKRGIYVYANEDINISNVNIKNAFGTGLFIRTDDATYSGASLTVQKNVNVTNATVDNRGLSGVGNGDMRYGALFIGAGTTPGMENIQVSNSQFMVNDGSAFTLFRNSGTGTAPISDVRIDNCLFSQLTYYTDGSTDYPTFSTFTIDGRNEPDDYVVDGLYVANSTFEGVYPARVRRLKNIVFKNCKFVVNDASSTYDAVKITNCNNIEFIDCTFDGHASASGDDINIGTGNTGTIRFVNCKALNSRVTVDASVTTAEFSQCEGFGYYNDWYNGMGSVKSTQSLGDDATITLESGRSGYGWVMAGDNEEFTQFRFTTTATVTLINNSTNAVSTDTDNKLCVYDGGTSVIIKNRLGSSKTIKYEVTYN